MAIIMGKGCLEAIYGLMGWKGLKGWPPHAPAGIPDFLGNTQGYLMGNYTANASQHWERIKVHIVHERCRAWHIQNNNDDQS